MSALQLGLIVAGIVLVVGVIVYNAWQERRVRARMAGHARVPGSGTDGREARRRTEPTLGGDADAPASSAAPDGAGAYRGLAEPPAAPFTVPMDDVTVLADDGRDGGPDEYDSDRVAGGTDPNDEDRSDPPVEPAESGAAAALPAAGKMGDEGALAAAAVPSAAGAARSAIAQPDPDIECIITLALAQPVTAALLSQGLHARLGKPLRWFGRGAAGAPWQLVVDASPGRFAELCACLLLADRNGALSEAQLNTFFRVVGEQGAALGARVTPPDLSGELQRGEALDRLCADLDVQIGLTVMKPEPGTVAGTRLRGVAEAAGFRLAPGGRFEHVQDDTTAVLYTLQNVRNEPFTAESLRVTSTNGVVFLLDVPRVADPARTFDQMKLVAKRMARTLGAELVDDNRRPLDDAALAKIRAQVQAATEGLAEVHIESGSTRAMALFGA